MYIDADDDLHMRSFSGQILHNVEEYLKRTRDTFSRDHATFGKYTLQSTSEQLLTRHEQQHQEDTDAVSTQTKAKKSSRLNDVLTNVREFLRLALEYAGGQEEITKEKLELADGPADDEIFRKMSNAAGGDLDGYVDRLAKLVLREVGSAFTTGYDSMMRVVKEIDDIDKQVSRSTSYSMRYLAMELINYHTSQRNISIADLAEHMYTAKGTSTFEAHKDAGKTDPESIVRTLFEPNSRQARMIDAMPQPELKERGKNRIMYREFSKERINIYSSDEQRQKNRFSHLRTVYSALDHIPSIREKLHVKDEVYLDSVSRFERSLLGKEPVDFNAYQRWNRQFCEARMNYYEKRRVNRIRRLADGLGIAPTTLITGSSLTVLDILVIEVLARAAKSTCVEFAQKLQAGYRLLRLRDDCDQLMTDEALMATWALQLWVNSLPPAKAIERLSLLGGLPVTVGTSGTHDLQALLLCARELQARKVARDAGAHPIRYRQIVHCHRSTYKEQVAMFSEEHRLSDKPYFVDLFVDTLEQLISRGNTGQYSSALSVFSDLQLFLDDCQQLVEDLRTESNEGPKYQLLDRYLKDCFKLVRRIFAAYIIPDARLDLYSPFFVETLLHELQGSELKLEYGSREFVDAALAKLKAVNPKLDVDSDKIRSIVEAKLQTYEKLDPDSPAFVETLLTKMRSWRRDDVEKLDPEIAESKREAEKELVLRQSEYVSSLKELERAKNVWRQRSIEGGLGAPAIDEAKRALNKVENLRSQIQEKLSEATQKLQKSASPQDVKRAHQESIKVAESRLKELEKLLSEQPSLESVQTELEHEQRSISMGELHMKGRKMYDNPVPVDEDGAATEDADDIESGPTLFIELAKGKCRELKNKIETIKMLLDEREDAKAEVAVLKKRLNDSETVSVTLVKTEDKLRSIVRQTEQQLADVEKRIKKAKQALNDAKDATDAYDVKTNKAAKRLHLAETEVARIQAEVSLRLQNLAAADEAVKIVRSKIKDYTLQQRSMCEAIVYAAARFVDDAKLKRHMIEHIRILLYVWTLSAEMGFDIRSGASIRTSLIMIRDTPCWFHESNMLFNMHDKLGDLYGEMHSVGLEFGKKYANQRAKFKQSEEDKQLLGKTLFTVEMDLYDDAAKSWLLRLVKSPPKSYDIRNQKDEYFEKYLKCVLYNSPSFYSFKAIDTLEKLKSDEVCKLRKTFTLEDSTMLLPPIRSWLDCKTSADKINVTSGALEGNSYFDQIKRIVAMSNVELRAKQAFEDAETLVATMRASLKGMLFKQLTEPKSDTQLILAAALCSYITYSERSDSEVDEAYPVFACFNESPANFNHMKQQKNRLPIKVAEILGRFDMSDPLERLKCLNEYKQEILDKYEGVEGQVDLTRKLIRLCRKLHEKKDEENGADDKEESLVTQTLGKDVLDEAQRALSNKDPEELLVAPSNVRDYRSLIELLLNPTTSKEKARDALSLYLVFYLCEMVKSKYLCTRKQIVAGSAGRQARVPNQTQSHLFNRYIMNVPVLDDSIRIYYENQSSLMDYAFSVQYMVTNCQQLLDSATIDLLQKECKYTGHGTPEYNRRLESTYRYMTRWYTSASPIRSPLLTGAEASTPSSPLGTSTMDMNSPVRPTSALSDRSDRPLSAVELQQEAVTRALSGSGDRGSGKPMTKSEKKKSADLERRRRALLGQVNTSNASATPNSRGTPMDKVNLMKEFIEVWNAYARHTENDKLITEMQRSEYLRVFASSSIVMNFIGRLESFMEFHATRCRYGDGQIGRLVYDLINYENRCTQSKEIIQFVIKHSDQVILPGMLNSRQLNQENLSFLCDMLSPSGGMQLVRANIQLRPICLQQLFMRTCELYAKLVKPKLDTEIPKENRNSDISAARKAYEHREAEARKATYQNEARKLVSFDDLTEDDIEHYVQQQETIYKAKVAELIGIIVEFTESCPIIVESVMNKLDTAILLSVMTDLVQTYTERLRDARKQGKELTYIVHKYPVLRILSPLARYGYVQFTIAESTYYNEFSVGVSDTKEAYNCVLGNDW